MKFIKLLFLCFLIVNSRSIINSDRDDLGVAEFKSDYGANVVKLVEDGSLEVSFYGDLIKIPKTLWEEFELLKILINNRGELLEEEITTQNIEKIYRLFKVIQSIDDLEKYSVSDLINLIYDADFLGITDWNLLKAILNLVKEKVTPDKLLGLNLPANKISFELISVTKKLNDVSRVDWAPNSLEYFVIFNDGKAQRYTITGAALGEVLHGVLRVNWDVDGQHYVAIYHDNTAQRYNTAGEPIGARQSDALALITSSRPDVTEKGVIYWAPDRQTYILVAGQKTGIYNLENFLICPLDPKIKFIYWAPNGQSFFSILSDYTASLNYLIGLDDLDFTQKLIVQAVFNEFKLRRVSIDLDPDLMKQLSDETIAELVEHGYIII